MITTHVLDTAQGKPAQGVPVELFIADGASWRRIGAGTTDADGRARTLLPADSRLAAGTYRLHFDTAAYFASGGTAAFYPFVEVTFLVSADRAHYHVPLLLAPFGYSTYRGS